MNTGRICSVSSDVRRRTTYVYYFLYNACSTYYALSISRSKLEKSMTKLWNHKKVLVTIFVVLLPFLARVSLIKGLSTKQWSLEHPGPIHYVLFDLADRLLVWMFFSQHHLRPAQTQVLKMSLCWCFGLEPLCPCEVLFDHFASAHRIFDQALVWEGLRRHLRGIYDYTLSEFYPNGNRFYCDAAKRKMHHRIRLSRRHCKFGAAISISINSSYLWINLPFNQN